MLFPRLLQEQELQDAEQEQSPFLQLRERVRPSIGMPQHPVALSWQVAAAQPAIPRQV